MPFYENGKTRIYYEEQGSGAPLLLISGGGLNSVAAFHAGPGAPFDAIAEFSKNYRCIAFDLRNATDGQSTGPLEPARPWDMHTDDQLGLLEHLGIDKFQVLGFCIGGPFIWNLLKRAEARVIAAVLAQPSGARPELPDHFYNNNMKGWGTKLLERRPDIKPADVDAFLSEMYRKDKDFVFTVDRAFVAACPTPLLVLPDDVPSHPFKVAMESALLAPNSQVSLYPWKERREQIPLAVRHISMFLDAHRPA